MNQQYQKQSYHQGQPIEVAGLPLNQAQAAMLMVHGRGASAKDILTVAAQLSQPGFAYLAPQAADNTWYPNRFMAPIAENEPWLSSALTFVDDVYHQIIQAGIPFERTMILGFSQGACLALEYAVRNPRRYGGVVGLSGALIGPDDVVRTVQSSFTGTPIFLGCSDVDPYVPAKRIRADAKTLSRMGAKVTERLYPNFDHSVNQDEINFVSEMMDALMKD